MNIRLKFTLSLLVSIGCIDESYSNIKDPELGGKLFVMNNDRIRKDASTNSYSPILAHTTLQASLDYKSQFYRDFLVLELGGYATVDIRNSASIDHEFNFVPWDNPWHSDYSQKSAKNGFSFYKGLLKLKSNKSHLKIGYFQPEGPGVLGVNWTSIPGAYLGGELISTIGNVDFSFSLVNQYKSSWFFDSYKFRRDDKSIVNYLYSIGAKYHRNENISFEAAYGESENYLKNAHVKYKHNFSLQELGEVYLTYQVYATGDSDNSKGVNDNFHDLAFQKYLGLHWSRGLYKLKSEFLYTVVKQNSSNHSQEFIYRLTNASGGSQGAYEPWWNARGGWGNNKEFSYYLGLWRSFEDFNAEEVSVGLAHAYGQGGESIKSQQELKESAWTFDFTYTLLKGKLKNSQLNIHMTKYDNRTDLDSFSVFEGAAQDEFETKISFSIPYHL